jgi:hypothetical protein
MAQRLPSTNGPGGASDAGDVDVGRHIEPERIGDGSGLRPPQAADVVHRAPTPFVWQHGRRLLLLDDEQRGWVMAELRFDVERCRYIEVRRATYRWTREAVGALLSRALASGYQAAEDLARSLCDWLARYYGVALYLDSTASQEIDSTDLSA